VGGALEEEVEEGREGEAEADSDVDGKGIIYTTDVPFSFRFRRDEEGVKVGVGCGPGEEDEGRHKTHVVPRSYSRCSQTVDVLCNQMHAVIISHTFGRRRPCRAVVSGLKNPPRGNRI